MIYPRGKMVLIQPDTEARISEIIDLPDDTRAKPKARGTVLATGPAVSRYVRTGDVVYFERFDWSRAGEGIIIREDEIMAREAR